VSIQTRQVAESGPEHLKLLERLRRTQLPSQHTLILVQVGVYSQANPTATTLYVVDVPDPFSSSTGDPVCVFRNVPEVFVNLAYPGRFKNGIALRMYDLRIRNRQRIQCAGS
jgi:hypothetical protein